MTKGRGGDYRVGKGKPPTASQWRKGQSGNPKGRPKKIGGYLFNPEDPQLGEVILTEAWRLVTVTQDGEPVTMPIAKLVLQAHLKSAVEGNSHAQRSVIQLVADAQAQRDRSKQEELMAALVLKAAFEEKRRQWVADGRDEAEMNLHPADIEIDFGTGEVKCYLPFTEEAFAARAKAVAFRDHLLRVRARSLEAAAEDGDDALLQLPRELAEGHINSINEHLPPRFRRTSHIGLTEGPLDRWAQEFWRDMMRDLYSELSRLRELRQKPEDSGCATL